MKNQERFSTKVLTVLKYCHILLADLLEEC